MLSVEPIRQAIYEKLAESTPCVYSTSPYHQASRMYPCKAASRILYNIAKLLVRWKRVCSRATRSATTDVAFSFEIISDVLNVFFEKCYWSLLDCVSRSSNRFSFVESSKFHFTTFRKFDKLDCSTKFVSSQVSTSTFYFQVESLNFGSFQV